MWFQVIDEFLRAHGDKTGSFLLGQEFSCMPTSIYCPGILPSLLSIVSLQCFLQLGLGALVCFP